MKSKDLRNLVFALCVRGSSGFRPRRHRISNAHACPRAVQLNLELAGKKFVHPARIKKILQKCNLKEIF